jgi:hypothetical protein
LAAAAIDHPNVLVIHDVGTHESTLHLVTERAVAHNGLMLRRDDLRRLRPHPEKAQHLARRIRTVGLDI